MADAQGAVNLAAPLLDGNGELGELEGAPPPATDASTFAPTGIPGIDDGVGPLTAADAAAELAKALLADREAQSGGGLAGYQQMVDAEGNVTLQPPTPAPSDGDGLPAGLIPPDAIPTSAASPGADAPAGTDPSPGPAGAPSQPEATLRIADVDVPVSAVPALLATWEAMNQITPEQAQAINDLLAGTHQIVPVNQPSRQPAGWPDYAPPYQAPPPVGQQQRLPWAQPVPPPVPLAGGGPGQPPQYPQPYPRPVQPGVPGGVQIDYAAIAETDPQLASALYAQQQQLATQQQQLQSFAAQQAQAQQATLRAELTAAQSALATELQLTALELDTLTRRTTETGLVAYYQQQTSNPRDAIAAAMRATYGMTPEFQEREFRRQQTLAALQEQQTATRRQNSTAVTGGAGQPIRTPPSSRPATQEEREAAIAAEIRRDIEQQ